MSFGFKWPNCFSEKLVLTFNFEIWVTFDQGQRMALTFDTHSTSLTHLAKCFKQLWDQGCNSFQKITNFHFFPYKSLCDQIWPWRKMGQGHPRVIIWRNLVELLYTMLHTKFQGHRSIGSGEEDFLRFLPYMGMAAMLVMWPRPFEQLFFPIGPGGRTWHLVAIGQVVSEKSFEIVVSEKSFEIVDGRQTLPIL